MTQQTNPKTALFTGGGSSGHITPNLAVAEILKNRGWAISYAGGRDSIEQRLATEWGAQFHGICTGKLRRSLSGRHAFEALKVLRGIVESFFLIRKVRPRIVFSKGGFVAFPVVLASWLNRVPVVIHESDRTLGLANRLSLPFASVVCTSFSETRAGRSSVEWTGNPIRPEIRHAVDNTPAPQPSRGSRTKLLIFGGSLGARKINESVRQALPGLLANFEIIHICGKDNVDPSLQREGYTQFEYLSKEFPRVLADSELVVCRAGANTMFELITAAKPAILIPLPKSGTRGDQILNAEWFVSNGFGLTIRQEDLDPGILFQKAKELQSRRDVFCDAMSRYRLPEATTKIADIIELTAKA